MKISRFQSCLFVLLIFTGLILSCDGSDGNSSGSTGADSSTTRETVTINGSLSDVVASKDVEQNVFIAEIKQFLTFINPAIAQEQEQVLEAILVEAFDGEMKVGEAVTDSAGEFTIENVPCNTPLTLMFTYEQSSVRLEGISAPCPKMGDEGVVSMVVSLNFQQDEVEAEEIEDDEDISESAKNCTSGEEVIDMNGEEYFIDGGGKACLITSGNCKLSIIASSVVLTNCSNCIDARGTSSVRITSTQFDCVANSDGVKTVGNSMVDITVVSSEMMDDTVMPSEAQPMQHMGDETIVGSGNGEILIIAGEDGVDGRGNSGVLLKAKEQINEQEMDDPERNMISRHGDSHIIVEGVENGIIAVGNSGVGIEAEVCEIIPGITERGNGEVEEDCSGIEDDDSPVPPFDDDDGPGGPPFNDDDDGPGPPF